jgi:hypothetical protein
MKKYCYLLLAALLYTLTSCGSGNDAEDASNIPDNLVKLETFSKSQNYTMVNSANSFGENKDVTCGLSVNIVYPEAIGNNNIQELQKQIVKNTLGADIEDFDNAFNQYATSNLAKEMEYELTPIEDKTSQSQRSITCSVETLSSDFAVFSINNYTYYYGAAHGMSATTYINYYIGEQRILSLKDIFDLSKKKDLIRYISAQRDDWMVNNLDLPADGSFYFSSDNTIYIVYQPMEVAPYSEGLVKVAIDPYQIGSILTPLAKKIFNYTE